MPPPDKREKGSAEKVALVDLDPTVEYRLAELERMGLPYPLAFQLAVSREDLHRLERAVNRGWTPEMIERVFL